MRGWILRKEKGTFIDWGDRAGKDVQQVKMIKDSDGNVLTSKQSMLRRWK